MATVADAVKAFVAETDEPEALVTQAARYLINSGDLPKNVGKRLSRVSERDVAMLLLGTYSPTKMTGAAERAREYAALTWGGEPGGLALGDFLTRAIRDLSTRPDRRVRINDGIVAPYDELRIEIVTSYPLVSVTAVPTIGKPAFQGAVNFAASPRDATRWRSSKPRRSVTIPGTALFNIVSRIFGLTMPPDEVLYDRVDPVED